jgi:hypothetical protein
MNRKDQDILKFLTHQMRERIRRKKHFLTSENRHRARRWQVKKEIVWVLSKISWIETSPHR